MDIKTSIFIGIVVFCNVGLCYVHASTGDRSQFFKNCMKGCIYSNCTEGSSGFEHIIVKIEIILLFVLQTQSSSKSTSNRIFLMKFYFGHVMMNVFIIACGEQQIHLLAANGRYHNFMVNGHLFDSLAFKSQLP